MIDGSTEVYGIIGSPLTSTISPYLHNHWFKQQNRNAIYIPFVVGSNSLKKAVEGLQALSIVGVNVTMPLKRLVVNYLDDLEPEVQSMNVANVVYNKDGRLHGYNTDVTGIELALSSSGHCISSSICIIIGAGGAARAALYYVLKKGYRTIYIVNRSIQNAKEMASESHLYDKRNYETHIIPFSDLRSLKNNEADLLINASSIGMIGYPDEIPDISQVLHPGMTVFDMVYNPVHTLLMQRGMNAGCLIVSGLKMLLFQAVETQKIWFGLCDDTCKKYYEEAEATIMEMMSIGK